MYPIHNYTYSPTIKVDSDEGGPLAKPYKHDKSQLILIYPLCTYVYIIKVKILCWWNVCFCFHNK